MHLRRVAAGTKCKHDADSGSKPHMLAGDGVALLSALAYGAYAVQVKHEVSSEAAMPMPWLFGLVGPMPCALCPVPHALCPVPCALFPVPCALCPMPCALGCCSLQPANPETCSLQPAACQPCSLQPAACSLQPANPEVCSLQHAACQP